MTRTSVAILALILIAGCSTQSVTFGTKNRRSWEAVVDLHTRCATLADQNELLTNAEVNELRTLIDKLPRDRTARFGNAVVDGGSSYVIVKEGLRRREFELLFVDPRIEITDPGHIAVRELFRTGAAILADHFPNAGPRLSRALKNRRKKTVKSKNREIRRKCREYRGLQF